MWPTHLRVVKIGRDFLRETFTRLCRETQVVGIETLSVQEMLQNYHLARAVADQGFGSFFMLLKYNRPRPELR